VHCDQTAEVVEMSWLLANKSAKAVMLFRRKHCEQRKCCVQMYCFVCNTDVGVVRDQSVLTCIQQFSGQQWKVVDVKSNGDCMFSALAHQLNQLLHDNTASAAAVRSEIVDYIRRHPNVASSILCLVNFSPTRDEAYANTILSSVCL